MKSIIIAIVVATAAVSALSFASAKDTTKNAVSTRATAIEAAFAETK